MNRSILLAFPIVFLTSCSGGMGSGPRTPAQAKADNSSFLTSLPEASQKMVLFCQGQFQSEVGGTVYIVAAPSLQSGDIQANSTSTVINSHVVMVYDRVEGAAVTSAARSCSLHSKNLVVHPSHAE
ncbi:hypothetical protein AruPA_08205 [Acidiphilium sp. PA]|uniref:hypothetical protein n=1 Tax=Acidiphilium sp. PA TaxID=2871705 RepID=UPI0022441C3F|nr:hypothetical protein [Acidiphilium sp. PA]MCW8307017.1 hypothetical protein [Acidiphilium sp. PA]